MEQLTVETARIVLVLLEPGVQPFQNFESELVYVVQRHGKDKHRAGTFDLPGGELVDGEDSLMAGRREFEEEAGQLPKDLEFFDEAVDERRSKYGHLNKRHFHYAFTRVGVNFRRNQECTRGFFVPKHIAAMSLGHTVQRQAARRRLPSQLLSV